MESIPSTVQMPVNQMGVAWGFLYGVNNPPEIFLPQLKKINVNVTKLYLFWQQVEPTKGTYNWDAVDTFLNQLESPDEALVAVFSASTWATKISSSIIPASASKLPGDYYHFIYSLVKHCKHKIRLWQNDCEPNNSVFWNGTVEEFISQLKIFSRAVRDADPHAKVVLGGYDGLFNPPGMPAFPGQEYGLNFFEKVIKEAPDCFDIFDIRLYADPYTIPARVTYFKKMLADFAQGQPIICSEYNGPGFYEFPENFQYINMVIEWQRVVASNDMMAFQKMHNPIPGMYENMSNLSPQTQMFMMGCSKELNDKYDRLQSRDIIIRNILAFSASVRKTMYWCLTDHADNKYDLMTLMFGKNKLVDYDKGKVLEEYPTSEVFKRMTGILMGFKEISKIDIPGRELLYCFKINKADGNIVYVVWEKRDAFSGENQPDTDYVLPLQALEVKAIDTFGKTIPVKVSKGNLEIAISETPVFIELSDN